MGQEQRPERVEREDMEQYRARRAEMAFIQERLRRGVRVSDRVRASSTAHPYSQHHVRIEGVDLARMELLRSRYAALSAQVERVERCIDGVGSAKVRLILTMRYIEGARWERIGDALGETEGAVRKLAERFFSSRGRRRKY